MNTILGLMAAGLLACSAGVTDQPTTTTKPAPATKPEPKKDVEILTGKVKRLDGTEEDLSKYKGKVVVIVNVASKCGYTVQYTALEAMYKQHKDDGLVILGFPANNFNGQEPGTNEEIAAFCKGTYDVTFPVFEKISVKGKDQHELYKKLSGLPEPLGGEPKWNFTKFVLDKEGKVVGRYDAKGEKGTTGRRTGRNWSRSL
ncbi:MAG: glutathione peroxidase [Phycisphaerales bacterium]